MDKTAKIYVAGHTGLIGSALITKLRSEGYENLLLRTHAQLELTDQRAVNDFFTREKPEYVFMLAAKVGGIRANREAPADFFYENMTMTDNVLWAACRNRVKKLLFLGSACMYPRDCRQPMKEEDILTGLPEATNEGYALAKISGCRLCGYLREQYHADFISAVPANAYGPNDCFDPEKSHVIPALLMKYHAAMTNGDPFVTLWGTGTAIREFIYTDDVADACVFLMRNYADAAPMNIGTGEEVSVLELSEMIKKIVGYQGEIVCDASKPDGMPRRMLDCARLNRLGWRPSYRLAEGLEQVYQEYKARYVSKNE
jgi:GDP-L-fucose synthase